MNNSNEELLLYHEELFETISDPNAKTTQNGGFSDNIFFDNVITLLEDNEVISERPNLAQYRSAKGDMAVSGYIFHESKITDDDTIDNSALSLFISYYSQTREYPSWNKEQIEKQIKLLKRFFFNCFKDSFVSNLDNNRDIFTLANNINKYKNNIKTIELYIITDAVVNMRKEIAEFAEDSVTFIVHTLDLNYIYQLAHNDTTGDLIYDFTDETFSKEVECCGIPCLEAQNPGADYRSYLAVIPGMTLAKLYQMHGTRMLESNVRAFLQNKGKVNRGIRDTIKDNPERFFAYNNGISAIADDVEVVNSKIVKMTNFQIVNGGQTTASIYSAYNRDKADLSKIFVQVKISQLPSDINDKGNIISKIAKYANSQNKINESDFFSSHAFNIRFEQLCKLNFVPETAPNRRTRWFYERARGSYATTSTLNLTDAQSKQFKKDFPKEQVIKITQLAKCLSVWDLVPHIVSKGAQYVTQYFATRVEDLWQQHNGNDDNTYINDAYCRQAIAKVIIFEQTDKIDGKAPWYKGSFKANIVAYTISYIAYRLEQMHKEMDFASVWAQQAVSPAFKEVILSLGELVLKTIVAGANQGNVTQYCKREACWQQIKTISYNFPESFLRELKASGYNERLIKGSRKMQRQDNQLFNEIAFSKLKPQQCRRILQDAASDGFFIKENERRALEAVIKGRFPNQYQVKALKELFERMEEQGVPTPDLS